MRNILQKSSLLQALMIIAVTSILFLSVGTAHALNSISTKYYTIVYDDNGEYTASEIAKFCDDVYERLIARYDAFGDKPKVTCLVNDAVDLANGYAIYYQNTITIYATSMDFELRGQSNWLRNVFVHEMTHMIALRQAARGPINFYHLSGGKYNDNPDINVSMVMYHLSQPAWFSEGTAQMGAEVYGDEQWDSHRDMVLRSAWKEKSLLSLDEMSVLSGKKGMDGEMVYNQGYSIVKYIKDTFGYDKLVEMNNTSGYFDFHPTIKRVLGIGARKLYDGWNESLNRRYATFRDRTFDEGEMVKDKGTSDYFPVVSPDGQYLAWLSNRDKDYAITDLMLTDLSSGKTRKLVERVDYRVAWSHDSKRLLYAKRPPRRPNFYDLYTFDIATDNELRISQQMRARDPHFSPDDSKIVFVRNEGGNNSLAIINSDGTGLRYLTATHDGTQFYRPSFSPDGSKIVFGVFRQDLDRDIGIIDTGGKSYRYSWDFADSTSGFSDSTSFADGTDFKLLLGTASDERDPWYLPDGSGIVYASDSGGVFNIYKLDFATNRASRLTDVYGGAFCPSVDGKGSVYYSGYKARNFSIYRTSLQNVITVMKPENEGRDYLLQPEKFELTKHFPSQPVYRKRLLNGIVPTLNIGPSFIGSRFGLNVINAGAELYLADLFGQDAFIAAGSVGRNLKKQVPLNNFVEVYYQKRLVPVTSSGYTHSPTMYATAARAEIHNHITRFKGDADSVYFADMPDIGYNNVLNDLHQEIDVGDIYRHEFRNYSIGLHVPLAPRHSFLLEAGHRQYYESIMREQVIRDFSTFIADGKDITDEVPGAGSTFKDEFNYFNDLEYFRSREISLGYSYFRMHPTADADVAPRGTAAMMRFRHMRTAIADSLVDQIEYFIPSGIYSDGSFAYSTYQPDPFLDQYRPRKKNLDVNEYMMFLQSYHKLPLWRHTLGGTIMAGYKDLVLKDANNGEGSGYNWPLKYYIGGRILSGYPYFSFWGSKLFYSRLDYTFPIRASIGKNLFGVHFQRLYGNIFFEAGQVWNFKKLTLENLKEGSLKRDIGVELRLKTIWFYRISAYLNARVVWPLDDMGDSPYRDRRDARRYYFELRM
ncbi:hypothetical protein ACFL47_01605 [Candidatus Latescibacterota bacterium]